ncbi:MAG: VanZ family protein [Bacteroidaceae bacterium]|nr:VanZ family protein [Bacteroidaceae bacterium]
MASFSYKNIARRYPWTTLTCVAIWVLSLAPIGDLELPVEGLSLSDKGAHFIMYGFLAMVVWCERVRQMCHNGLSAAGLCGLMRRLVWPHLAWTFVAPVAMSGVLELMQNYCTTYRSGEWLDFAANTIGACSGNVVALLATLLLPRKRQ